MTSDLYRRCARLFMVGFPGTDVDPEFAADALLAVLTAELVLHQRRGRGIPLAELQRGWEQLARRVASS